MTDARVSFSRGDTTRDNTRNKHIQKKKKRKQDTVSVLMGIQIDTMYAGVIRVQRALRQLAGECIALCLLSERARARAYDTAIIEWRRREHHQ